MIPPKIGRNAKLSMEDAAGYRQRNRAAPIIPRAARK